MKRILFFVILFSVSIWRAQAAEPAKPVDKAAAQIPLLKQSWGRNPFTPVEFQVKTGAAPGGELKLTGILLRGGKSIAIINRQFLKEGDTIQGVSILKIEKDRVQIDKDGEPSYLRIGTNEKTQKIAKAAGV